VYLKGFKPTCLWQALLSVVRSSQAVVDQALAAARKELITLEPAAEAAEQKTASLQVEQALAREVGTHRQDPQLIC
jgi:hypothetical protein